MDPTIPPSLPVCDRRPVGPPCRGEEVVSGCQTEAICGIYALLVWTPNLLLRFWTIVGKPSFCFCPCQRDKTKSCSSHLAACGLVSGHYHSPQAICGSGMVSRLCLTQRVLIQQFPPTSLNMKYRVKPNSFSKSFTFLRLCQMSLPMCYRILLLFWKNMGILHLSGFFSVCTLYTLSNG